jgi:hypothetical protein
MAWSVALASLPPSALHFHSTFLENPMSEVTNNSTPAHDPFRNEADYHEHFKETDEYKNMSKEDRDDYDSKTAAEQTSIEKKVFAKAHPDAVTNDQKDADKVRNGQIHQMMGLSGS